MAELRAAGVPLSPLELNNWYTQVPAEKNAAHLVLGAINTMIQAPGGADPYAGKYKLPAPGEPLSPELRRIIDRHLSNNAPALAQLRALKISSESRYPVNLASGAATLLPHLANLKSTAQILKLDAISAAYAGDAERSAGAVIAGLAVANTIKSEPLLISQLVRYACAAIAMSALEVSVSATDFSPDQLSRLENALQETEEQTNESIYKGLIGERAVGLATFSMSLADLERFSGGTATGAMEFSTVAKQLFALLHRTVGLRERDKRVYLEMMGLFTEAVRQPYPERLKASQAVSAHMDDRFKNKATAFTAPLSRLLLPSFAKAAEKEAFNIGQLRCARTALAVERFRISTGKLPSTLQELLPEYLAELPSDPFEGNPLELELLPEGSFRVKTSGVEGKRCHLTIRLGGERR